MGYHRKLSLTGQWQFSGSPGPIGSCLKQRIIPLYGHTTYGHMSLTTVNDKSLWTKLKKVSLTLVNDKKIVIDHGQWQKKLSLTERYLYRDISRPPWPFLAPSVALTELLWFSLARFGSHLLSRPLLCFLHQSCVAELYPTLNKYQPRCKWERA